uniref:Autophagy-related protein 7 n=2 Tax=Aegilops tauschii subsp. strangulata TaxID=200361 RepID=A0A453BZ79_AEGTS
CAHPKIPGLVRLSSKSLEASPPFHSRNNCIVPRTLVNTNNMLGFKNLDVDLLLKEEGKRIFYDILSGKIEEDPTLLLRFLVISFVDLKNWKVYYDVAFPSLVLNSKMTFLRLHSASEVLSQEEETSLSKSMKVWRDSNETTGCPFFGVHIYSDSSVVIRQLKCWKGYSGDHQKLLFGFYDHGHQDYPGWALRNYIAFLSLRWKIEKVQFLCYRERRGEPDLEKSLIGEASFAAPHGWDGSDYVPEIIGWEGEKAGDRKKEKILKPIDLDSLNPASQDEEKQVMHLKLMGWRHPSLVLNKLRSARCLVLGAGALGCEVSRLLMTWGVRKLTVVDGGCVAIPDIVKQSLYVDNDCGVPRATAIVPHLKERCPAVEVEGIQMEIPVPGNPVSKTKMSSVLDNCKRLQALVASSDVVFLLTDTWESRWFPTLLCANENKIAITAASGYDSYLVMRHGAGPGHNLSTEDALGHQRLGCCFCNDSTSFVNVYQIKTLVLNETVALPGLTSIASGKAVELFARILHHEEGIHAPGDIAGMDTEHWLGLLPHQMQGSLPECALSTVIGNSSNDCNACSNGVLSEYRREGLDFIMKAINQPTYLKDLTGVSNNVIKLDTCLTLPVSFPVNSGKLSSV